jgi:hypothetical protein
MRYILILFLLSGVKGFSQWKDFQLNTKGDTVNRVDAKNMKQGKWIIRQEENMGEPGTQEEGFFQNDLKEGEWHVYNLMGDMVGKEKYVYGQKSGVQHYFDIKENLLREENWKAITPDNMYDTVRVPDWRKDVTGNTFKTVVVKLEGNALRHGAWKYYDETGKLVRTDVYILDKMSESTVINYDYKTGKISGKEKTNYDIETGRIVASAAYQKPKEVVKPDQVIKFEKTKKGKSKKYVDGSTG